MRARAASSPTRPWCFRSAIMSSWTERRLSMPKPRQMSGVNSEVPCYPGGRQGLGYAMAAVRGA
eukprot:1558823-Prymnesium_polylepis.1